MTNFDKINPIPIKGKQIKRKEEKLHDGRWRFIIPHKILVITDSHPLDYLFPHNFISNAIDDDKKITGELLGCDSCENNLPPYLYVTEERDPRGVLSIIMVSRYWIAFFIKTSTAWAGEQGNKTHHFDRCMLKSISGNLPRLETSCINHWNYSFSSGFKYHQFECTQCLATIKFKQCNSFDSEQLLVTALCLHYGIKIPLNHYVGNLRNMNHIEYMKPCSKLTGFF